MGKLMEIIEYLDNTGDSMVQRVPEDSSGEFKNGCSTHCSRKSKGLSFSEMENH